MGTNAIDIFLEGVQSVADEFLGWDRYEVYRQSRDKALAELAALHAREQALVAALQLVRESYPNMVHEVLDVVDAALAGERDA